MTHGRIGSLPLRGMCPELVDIGCTGLGQEAIQLACMELPGCVVCGSGNERRWVGVLEGEQVGKQGRSLPAQIRHQGGGPGAWR